MEIRSSTKTNADEHYLLHNINSIYSAHLFALEECFDLHIVDGDLTNLCKRSRHLAAFACSRCCTEGLQKSVCVHCKYI